MIKKIFNYLGIILLLGNMFITIVSCEKNKKISKEILSKKHKINQNIIKNNIYKKIKILKQKMINQKKLWKFKRNIYNINKNFYWKDKILNNIFLKMNFFKLWITNLQIFSIYYLVIYGTFSAAIISIFVVYNSKIYNILFSYHQKDNILKINKEYGNIYKNNKIPSIVLCAQGIQIYKETNPMIFINKYRNLKKINQQKISFLSPYKHAVSTIGNKLSHYLSKK